MFNVCVIKTLKQVTQRHCGGISTYLSICGDTQSLTGWGSRQPSLVDPPLGMRFGADDCQRSHPALTVLCSVIPIFFSWLSQSSSRTVIIAGTYYFGPNTIWDVLSHTLLK